MAAAVIMITDMPVNAADLTAAAYRRRKARYPVIAETLGLALLLLINRSTARDRAPWLALDGGDIRPATPKEA
jgi:hypothetical protein